MQKTHYEKIKLIYIDPPYNTLSSNFAYKDKRTYKLDDLLEIMNKTNAKEVLKSDKNNISHSAWLAFMQPRLELAKNLLKDDGVIFISIDDNELAQLKLLCDEVFGEDNFLNIICVELSTTQGMKLISAKKNNIVKNAEFLLVYAKDKAKHSFIDSLYVFRDFDEHYNIYINPKTKEKSSLLAFLKNHFKDINKNKLLHLYKNDLEFKDFIHKHSNDIYMDGSCKVKLDLSLEDEDKLNQKMIVYKNAYLIYKTKGGKIRQLIPLSKAIGKTDDFIPTYGLRKIRGDWWSSYYKDMMNINNEGNVVYKNGKKPIRLIKDILKITTKDDDLMLDFFAGSGTSAHALMQLNAEDGGNRRFILVQLDEEVLPNNKDNAKLYDFLVNVLKKDANIYELTKERLLRAIKQIKNDYPNAKNLEFCESFLITKN